MHLKIDMLWSPDLPEGGAPPDVHSFSVFMQVALKEPLHRGHEVFQFFVHSAGTDNREHQPALEIERFDWQIIRARIDELLERCRSCQTWDEVIAVLSPSLEYSDR